MGLPAPFSKKGEKEARSALEKKATIDTYWLLDQLAIIMYAMGI